MSCPLWGFLGCQGIFYLVTGPLYLLQLPPSADEDLIYLDPWQPRPLAISISDYDLEQKFDTTHQLQGLWSAQDVLVVTAPGSGAEVIPFLKTWVNLPMAIGFTVLYAKVCAGPSLLPLLMQNVS